MQEMGLLEPDREPIMVAVRRVCDLCGAEADTPALSHWHDEDGTVTRTNVEATRYVADPDGGVVRLDRVEVDLCAECFDWLAHAIVSGQIVRPASD